MSCGEASGVAAAPGTDLGGAKTASQRAPKWQKLMTKKCD